MKACTVTQLLFQVGTFIIKHHELLTLGPYKLHVGGLVDIGVRDGGGGQGAAAPPNSGSLST